MKMMELVLWNCLGNPRLLNHAVDYLANNWDIFKNLSRGQIYNLLTRELKAKLADGYIPLKVVAAAFCQHEYRELDKDLEELAVKDYGVSSAGNQFIRRFPLISPIYMNKICQESLIEYKKDKQGDQLERNCVLYLKDLFKFTEAWTLSLVDKPEVSGETFEQYFALWLRAYLTCRKVCEDLPLLFSELLQSQIIGSTPSPAVHLQSQYYILKTGGLKHLSAPHDLVDLSSEGPNIPHFMKTKKKISKEVKDFRNGQSIIMCRDHNPGFDFFVRFKTDCKGSKVEPGHIDALVEIKSRSRSVRTDNEHYWTDVEDNHCKIAKDLISKESWLMFVTLRKFNQSNGPNPKDLRAMVLSRDAVLRLAGPSLGFIVPIHVEPDRFTPTVYAIKRNVG